MTNEEAIVILENEKPHCGRRITFTEEEKCEAFEMAIEALKTQPCERCVSIEAVLDALHVEGRPTKRFEYAIEVRRDIEALPPAAPKQKIGKWIREPIRNEKGGCIGAKMICSECGHDNKHDEYMDYCPNCGVKMEEKMERENE